MGGYAAFGAGDMEALSKVYHPDCKITFHANHALGGEYHGFNDLLGNMLAKLNDAWPGFNLSVDNVVSNATDVVVFCTFTADGGISGKGVHHFVVQDGWKSVSTCIGIAVIGVNIVKFKSDYQYCFLAPLEKPEWATSTNKERINVCLRNC